MLNHHRLPAELWRCIISLCSTRNLFNIAVVSRWFADNVHACISAITEKHSAVVTEDVLRRMCGLTKLALLYNQHVNDVSSLVRLTSLNISHCRVRTGVSKLTSLTVLDLAGNNYIGDEDIQHLPLMSLNVNNNTLITDKAIIALHRTLTYLKVGYKSPVTDAALCGAGRLTTLVCFHYSQITDVGVGYVPSLTSLNLWGNSSITSNAVSRITMLRTLDIDSNPMISNWCIAQLPLLTSLNLKRNTVITDAGVSCLSQLRLLNLSLNHTITDAGIQHLALTELILEENAMITNDGIKYMTTVRSLNLYHNHAITDINHLSALTTLDLQYNCTITDACIRGLSLTSLNLTNNNVITDRGIKHMSSLTVLTLAHGETTKKFRKYAARNHI